MSNQGRLSRTISGLKLLYAGELRRRRIHSVTGDGCVVIPAGFSSRYRGTGRLKAKVFQRRKAADRGPRQSNMMTFASTRHFAFQHRKELQPIALMDAPEEPAAALHRHRIGTYYRSACRKRPTCDRAHKTYCCIVSPRQQLGSRRSRRITSAAVTSVAEGRII